ncbi:hypothetical protein I552_1217 [Mycobacterium xenopi 3993]|nr:hypothetical protein I552_1217 [Mycobacterium xenopi 3993]
MARAQLNRRITLWRRLYPDVHIEPTVIRGGVCQYLAKNAQSVQLFVTGRAAAVVTRASPVRWNARHSPCAATSCRKRNAPLEDVP